MREALPGTGPVWVRMEVEAKGPVTMTWRFGERGRTEVDCLPDSGSIRVDRAQSGRVDFHRLFPGSYTAPLPVRDGRFELEMVLDASSLEVFAGDGATAVTALIFPEEGERRLEIRAESGEAVARRVDVWALRSVWGE
jgi:sucrose-6-phosphate hydrolase SacC (GH32 family)